MTARGTRWLQEGATDVDFETLLKFVVVMLTIIGVPAFFMVMAPVARGLGRRLAGKTAGREELEAMQSELSELRELRGLPDRVAELEERLDFAERLLSRREGVELPGERH
jgi:hypothetical protein